MILIAVVRFGLCTKEMISLFTAFGNSASPNSVTYVHHQVAWQYLPRAMHSNLQERSKYPSPVVVFL